MNKRSLLTVAAALLLTALLAAGMMWMTGSVMARHMDVIVTVNPLAMEAALTNPLQITNKLMRTS